MEKLEILGQCRNQLEGGSMDEPYNTILLILAIMLCITPQNTTFGDNTAECQKPIILTPS